MTSNLRSLDEVRASLRPEFINRIDEIVVFEQLTREQLADIVELQLKRLRERLAERKIEVELTDAAKGLLAEVGWDPAYGARPLKRALQRLVENPLALALLDGGFQGGRHRAGRRRERRSDLRARRDRGGRGRAGIDVASGEPELARPLRRSSVR